MVSTQHRVHTSLEARFAGHGVALGSCSHHSARRYVLMAKLGYVSARTDMLRSVLSSTIRSDATSRSDMRLSAVRRMRVCLATMREHETLLMTIAARQRLGRNAMWL